MENEEQGRTTGTQQASARPFVGAAVNYIGQDDNGLLRGERYAATITAVNGAEVSLHVIAPTTRFNLPGVRFSPTPEPGSWTWPATGA